MTAPDFKTACRMAKASDVTYYVDASGGMTSCPNYAGVGFVSLPTPVTADGINAALVGTTATEVIVAFRGTLRLDTKDWDDFIDSLLDWINDANAILVSVPYATGLVHRGFSESLQSLWGPVLTAVRAQQTASGLPVVVTGHSKGGALASLGAIRLVNEAHITPQTVYTFASPRTGDSPFAAQYNQALPVDWRFENTNDIVPHLPPTSGLLEFLAEVDPRLRGLRSHDYQSVGHLEYFNWSGGLDQGSSLALDAQRMLHLAELLATGQIRQIADDHSIEGQYLPKTCRLTAPGSTA
ncbi:MAG: lipase family protein [Planctomycetales bacterium]